METKKNILLLVSIFVIGNIFAQIDRSKLDAQLNSSTKSFFRASKFRVALSLSVDGAYANAKGKSIYIKPVGSFDKENITFAQGFKNISLGLGIDFYSPFSTLGFFIEPTYSRKNYALQNKINNLTDSTMVNSLEIPIYTKLRFGKPKGISHSWLALGIGYSFLTSATTRVFENSSFRTGVETKRQFKSIPFLSAILGYEILSFATKDGKEVFDRDDFRLLLFIKGNYDLGNRIDNSGVFTNTSLASYTNPELKFFRLTYGVKLLFRFANLGKVSTAVIKNVGK